MSGTIWNDSNADGALAAGEPGRYGGVTVALLDSNGDVVATTTTKPDGSYSFPNLPAGSYTVDVTDDGNVLNGTWHSLGTANTPGQSQTDPKPVTVTAGVTTVVDFGYYRDPAALGNFVWDDLNKNGIQDPGEPGIDGVLVTLTVTYPNGATTTVKTVTGDDPATTGRGGEGLVQLRQPAAGRELQRQHRRRPDDYRPSEIHYLGGNAVGLRADPPEHRQRRERLG